MKPYARPILRRFFSPLSSLIFFASQKVRLIFVKVQRSLSLRAIKQFVKKREKIYELARP